MSEIEKLIQTLEEDGIVLLPELLAESELSAMQASFDMELKQPRWNTSSGYQQNEKWRLLLEDVLTLDPAFLTLAIHPLARSIFSQYIGSSYILAEARGWETIATQRDFHGWHNDAWYDTEKVETRPRELKIGYYLTDVETGHFEYIRASHKLRGIPRHWGKHEIAQFSDDIVEVKGKAGSAFIFDTAGIHRQSSPVLTPRRVLLYTYHDSSVPIQEKDMKYGRYHSLLLRASFLGGLSDEERRVLGFGNMDYFTRFERPKRRYPLLHETIRRAMNLRLEWQDIAHETKNIFNGIRRRLRKNQNL